MSDRKKPTSWAAEVIADDSGEWCGNGLRFEHYEDAAAWVADLASRWILVQQIRVVESDDPVTEWLKTEEPKGAAEARAKINVVEAGGSYIEETPK
jgi:hypothetical protein